MRLCFLVARTQVLLLLLGGLLLTRSPLQGEEPPLWRASDIQVMLTARDRLDKHPDFTDLQLGIEVHQGVVRVWGGILDHKQKKRIESELLSIPGLRKVNMQCHVQSYSDSLMIQFAQLARDTLPESVMPDLPPMPRLPSHQSPREPPVAAARRSPAPGPSQLAVAPPEHRRTVAPAIPTSRQPQPGNVSPQVAHPGTQRQSSRAPELDLFERLEKIRWSDPRFRQIQINLHPVDAERSGFVVRLSGAVRNMGWIWELTQQLEKQPGVERVSINNVRTP